MQFKCNLKLHRATLVHAFLTISDVKQRKLSPAKTIHANLPQPEPLRQDGENSAICRSTCIETTRSFESSSVKVERIHRAEETSDRVNKKRDSYDPREAAATDQCYSRLFNPFDDVLKNGSVGFDLFNITFQTSRAAWQQQSNRRQLRVKQQTRQSEDGGTLNTRTEP